MSFTGLAGRVQTVLGTIHPRAMGVTLPHEHLVFDGTSIFCEPTEAGSKGIAHRPVDWDNLSWLRYHPYENLDNVRLLDEQEAVDELMLLKQAGGQTVVDVTVEGIGRDPAALARISRATGINIIMGTGYYVESSLRQEILEQTEEEICRTFATDITSGAAGTTVRAGLIGEIGCSWPLQPNEKKCLRAAAHAQRDTGACINVHSGRNRHAPFEIMDILGNAGADLSRVIMSHIDARVRVHQDRCRLAAEGCCLEYDLWGWEGHFPSYWTSDDYMDLPNDTQRIYEVRDLIDAGYIDRLLISHDICIKSRRVRYGGWGYVHIPRYVVPTMLKRGMTREQVGTIMVHNPKRLFTFV